MRTIFKKVLRPLLVALACGSVSVHGEDIDLFLGSSGTGANILFVIDNSSNWAANNQNWPTDTGSSGPASWCGSNCDKQGYYELKALYNLVSDAGILTDTMNVGLMMFNNSTSSRDGGYVRVAVAELGKLGESSHRDKLLGEIESAIRNFNTETTGSSVQYAATLFDAYKYFGGYSNPARTYPATPAITNPTYDGIGVFGTAFWGDNDDDKYADKSLKRDASAYSGANYVPSIDQYNNCAKNYIIFIGNGFPAADDVASSDMSKVLRLLKDPANAANPAVVSQLNMPASATYLVTQCANESVCLNTDLPAAKAAFNTSPTTQPYCSTIKCEEPVAFACAAKAPDNSNYCTGNKFRVVASGAATSGGVEQPSNNTLRYGDEFAEFISSSDVSAEPGDQYVNIFTLDVFRAQPDARQNQLMRSIASYGGGDYYPASDYDQIENALEDIVRKINAVNSVFASASLPVSATNRAQNENQVYIGLFRPDSELGPRWPGNLKRYQIVEKIVDGKQGFTLGDKYGADAVNVLTGFIDDCAVSFWTQDQGPYWNGISIDSGVPLATKCTKPLPPGTATSVTYAVRSDLPDGPSVEKGAVSQVIRLGNVNINTVLPATPETPTFSPAGRKIFTANGNLLQPISADDTTPADETLRFALGYDVNNQRPGGDTTGVGRDKLDVRPSVHGDVIHSRPLPLNFSAPSTTAPSPNDPAPNVAIFYGSNDGMFRAVDANTGQEKWAFIDPDDYRLATSTASSRMARLKTNDPLMFYPQVSYGWGDVKEEPLPKDYFFDGSATAYQELDSSKKPIKSYVYNGMRRGGRMVYAFDVSNTFAATGSTDPALKWKFGCTMDGSGCVGGANEAIGQTWSTPTVFRAKTETSTRMVVGFGGGYDGGFPAGFNDEEGWSIADERKTLDVAGYNKKFRCDDQDKKISNPPQASDNAVDCINDPKGHSVLILDAEGNNGSASLLRKLPTEGPVAADIALVDMDTDGNVDYGYAADTRGNLYRISFRDSDGALVKSTGADTENWGGVSIKLIARTTQTDSSDTTPSGRKFLFAPSVLSYGGQVYVAIGSGDREHPLRRNYPWEQQVKNRFYLFLDNPSEADSVPPYNLDDPAYMYNAAETTTLDLCNERRVLPGATMDGKTDGPPVKGWYLDLASQPLRTTTDVHRGEQVVTSALIAAGVVFFSTNSPDEGSQLLCTNNLGIARGYALNLLNGTGALDNENNTYTSCGVDENTSASYGEFAGGGLPPSPVLGRVVYKWTDGDTPTPVVGTICIGCISPGAGTKPPISPTAVKPPIKPKRDKIYWYNNTDRRTK